ncbi:uncharacterized protein FA14DRAFT_159021 [Meira miltonrushii]|uniref:Uncharacterized protein n=1 Tax=Meira miltonrushii TaxID=1280837 RepID=A0A316VFZ6_9BASI|nr:uncharacterized protein FA14DRAFT_159021 [Meira miltonrushii]PWN36502.1 hypothetical protein FA14DRAFT_159021 [Meira miltonrushii]
MNGKRRQVVVFIDWDETITSHDTLSLIAPPDDKHEGVPFAEYGKAYVEDLKQHEKAWQYQESASRTGDEISIPRKGCNLGKGWEEQWAYQGSLDTVELASQKRIEEGGLFRNADPKELERRAIDKVQCRKGWSGNPYPRRIRTGDWGSWLLDRPLSTPLGHQEQGKPDWQYHIISVGWSARFITAALKKVNNNQFMPTSICANEIEIDQCTGLGTGKLTKSYDAQKLAERSFRPGEGGIRTGQHKVREMRRILETCTSDPDPITIYVGDSTTDLGSLLEAHIGLIIGQSTSLYNTINKAGLEKFKIACSDGKIRDVVATQIAENHQPCLIKVNDWEDVGEVMEIISELITKSHKRSLQE